MSDLPMQQEDHPAHNMPDATQAYSGDKVPMPKPDPRGYFPIIKSSDGTPVYSDVRAMKRDGN